MKKNLNLEINKPPKYEIVIQLRDYLGNSTGKTRTFTANSAEELEEIWQKNSFTRKTRDKEENVKRHKTR